MAKLHQNTTWDPDEKAHALVSELEREALDEDQVATALQHIIQTLCSRQECSVQIVQQEAMARLSDRRTGYIKAGIKGVKPVPPGDRRVEVASVIPTRH